MVKVSDLHVGDRVRIVDHWGPGCAQNANGHMDSYLGQIVTVSAIVNDGDGFEIYEDNRHEFYEYKYRKKWVFFASCIAEIICDEDEAIPDSQLSSPFSDLFQEV